MTENKTLQQRIAETDVEIKQLKTDFFRIAKEQEERNAEIIIKHGELIAYQKLLAEQKRAERQAINDAAVAEAERVAAEEQSGSAGGKTWPPEQ